MEMEITFPGGARVDASFGGFTLKTDQLPPDFPEKYKAAVIRSAEQCAVKKYLEHPPRFNVTTSTVEAVAA